MPLWRSASPKAARRRIFEAPVTTDRISNRNMILAGSDDGLADDFVAQTCISQSRCLPSQPDGC